jgi:hypothetical protein
MWPEGFDGSTAPALPPDWTVVAGDADDGGNDWATTEAEAFSGVNSATAVATTAMDMYLVSPPILL